ncbi:NifB/NifX family molybdenum-iron cluster-binding protein [Elusimicrobiota bacterium]
MKICVTSTGNNLDSQVDPRFGRCQYFVFYDYETGKSDIVENQAADAAHGAGIQASQLVIERKPEAVITGNIGPNASSVLFNAGVKVYSATGKIVQEAIESYNQGKLKELTGPNVQGHFGLGKGNK